MTAYYIPGEVGQQIGIIKDGVTRSKVITDHSGASAPSPYTANSARLLDGGDGSSLLINVFAVPSNGGSPRTAVEYRVDGGDWTAIGFLGTGSTKLTDLTTGQSYVVDLRSTNIVGTCAAYQMTAAPQAPSAFAPEGYVRVGQIVQMGGDYTVQGSDVMGPALTLDDGRKVFVVPALQAPSIAATIGGVPKVDDVVALEISDLQGWPPPAATCARLMNSSAIVGDDPTSPYYRCTETGTLNTTVTATNGSGSAQISIDTTIGAAAVSPSAFGIADPVLSCNIGGATYFSTQQFLNIVKTARQPHKAGNNGKTGINTTYLIANGHLDANEYPASLPDGVTELRILWQFADPADTEYTVRWAGTGSLSFSGDAKNVSLDTGAKTGTFQRKGEGGFLYCDMVPPITSLEIVKTEHLALYDAGEIYVPENIELLRDMRDTRFLDASGVNGSNAVDWVNRRTPDWISFNGANTKDPFPTNNWGLPIEYQVELCNRLGADGWFFFPRFASSDYVANLVAYVRDNLNEGLVPTFEYGNEPWNNTLNGGVFFQYLRDTVPTALGWDVSAYLVNSAGKHRITRSSYVYRLCQIMPVVDATMAGSRPYHKAINTQAANGGVFNEFVQAEVWNVNNPTERAALWGQPNAIVDTIAIGPYYGGASFISSRLPALEAALNAGIFNEYLFDALMTPGNNNSFPAVRGFFVSHRAHADNYGMRLTAYEGGQHMLHSGNKAETVPGLVDALIAFGDTEYNVECYAVLFELSRQYLDGPFRQFNYLGPWTRSGAWTFREDYADREKFSEMLFTLNRAVPNWWGGPATGYQSL